MGISERKARHRDDLRRKVLAAAEELFVADGYRNVSMRKIARQIEYSATTIYRLFKNKDEIMEQLIAEGYVGVYQRYQEIVERATDDPLDGLEQIIRSYIEFALANPRHYDLWFATGEIEAAEGRLYMSHGGSRYQVYSIWLDHIEECRRRGLLAGEDTLALFQTIWAAVHGLISLRLHHPGFPWMPLDSHIDQLIGMIENGLSCHQGETEMKPRPGTVRRA